MALNGQNRNTPLRPCGVAGRRLPRPACNRSAALPARRGDRSGDGHRPQPHELREQCRKQFRRTDRTPCQRLSREQVFQQRYAGSKGAAALYDRPQPALHHPAFGRSFARIGACAGGLGPQQLRTRRAAGAYRRHQSDAARPVYGRIRRRAGRRAFGRAAGAQRTVAGGLYPYLCSDRRHHRFEQRPYGRLRGRGYPIFGADDHFEHRYRCGRCRHSDGAVSPLCGDAPVDL